MDIASQMELVDSAKHAHSTIARQARARLAGAAPAPKFTVDAQGNLHGPSGAIIPKKAKANNAGSPA